MADNTILNSGTGGDTIATDDIGGIKHQRVKVQHGADGSATDVSAASPLPVDASGVAVPVTDNGGSLTVDGTVAVTGVATAANQLPDGHNVTVDNASIAVTAASLPLPTGAATSAAQLADGHNVTLAAGANTIGEVTIGAATTAAGDLAKAEDAVHASGDVGVMALAVRNDTLAALAGTDGDYGPLQVNADGALYVEVQNLGGTSNADSIAGTTDSGAVSLAVRDDALTTLTQADGDYTQLRVNSTGALHVTGAGGGTQYTISDAAPTVVTMAGTIRDDTLTTLTEADGDASALRVSSTGALHVTDAGAGGGVSNLVSTNNSTTTPLGISAAFTGTGDDVSSYTSVSISLDTDVASATDGMAFQFSQDNTNWDDVYAFTYAATDTHRRFQFPVTAQYFRVVFTNGGTGQAHFRVQTILHRNPITTSVHRLGDDETPDRSSVIVKSVLMAQAAGSGNFTPVDATGGGNLKTSISEISDGLDIGAGNAGGETARVSISTDDVNLAAINAGQLPDGHNVTIDNASGASAVNIQDGGNSITIDGAVTADLGANNDIQGQVAHDAAVSGNPLVAGARATNSVEGITQVANGDATRLQADLNGVLLSRPHTTPEEHISERVSNTNGTSTAFTNFAAQGAGIHNYVTDVTVYNSSATDGYVDIRDGTAGSVIWTFPLPAAGGATHSFSLPLKGAANTALAFDVSAALTTVYISVNGFAAQG